MLGPRGDKMATQASGLVTQAADQWRDDIIMHLQNWIPQSRNRSPKWQKRFPSKLLVQYENSWCQKIALINALLMQILHSIYLFTP